mgnify:CR=1 FL=1|tara:strand:+ start:297 stop:1637 length:1341 start_codon:yes stop_codon:yes gene_type:complete
MSKVGVIKKQSAPPVRVDYDMVSGQPVYVTGRDRARTGHVPTMRERAGGYVGRGLGAASALTGQHRSFNSFMNALLMGWDRGKHLGQAAGRFFVPKVQQERADIRGAARDKLRSMEEWDRLAGGEEDTSRFGWRSRVPFMGRKYRDPKVAEFRERLAEERRRDAREQYAPQEEWERLMQNESFINEMSAHMGISPEEFRQQMGDFISTAAQQGFRMEPQGSVRVTGPKQLTGPSGMGALPAPSSVAVRDDSDSPLALPAPSDRDMDKLILVEEANQRKDAQQRRMEEQQKRLAAGNERLQRQPPVIDVEPEVVEQQPPAEQVTAFDAAGNPTMSMADLAAQGAGPNAVKDPAEGVGKETGRDEQLEAATTLTPQHVDDTDESVEESMGLMKPEVDTDKPSEAQLAAFGAKVQPQQSQSPGVKVVMPPSGGDPNDITNWATQGQEED